MNRKMRAEIVAVWAIAVSGIGLSESSSAAPPGVGTDWPTYGGDYAQTRFSRLARINRDNVDRLTVRWTFSTGRGADQFVSFQTNPIVVNGTMFITDPGNFGSSEQHVFAVNAKTGELVWNRSLPLRAAPELLGYLSLRSSKGVAVGGDKVFANTLDARLWALDVASGEPVADFGDGVGPAGSVTVADNEAGFYQTMAPLFIPKEMTPQNDRDLVIVGISGGEHETRGFVTAYDADTGELVWRFFTVPGPDEIGGDTWPTIDPPDPFTDPFTRGGGPMWMTPTYDSELGLLIFGTGNAAPDLDGSHRTGDNLFTASIVALDISTGEHVWHFQEVHHDIWDYDQGSPPVLFDVRHSSGRPIKAVGAAGKTGWFYILNRATGEPIIPCPEQPVPASTVEPETSPTQPFCESDAFVPQGDRYLPSGEYVQPIFTPPGAPGEQVGPFLFPFLPVPNEQGDFEPTEILVPINDAIVEPGAIGGSEWSSVSLNPRLGLAYLSGNVLPMSLTVIPETTAPNPGGPAAGGHWSYELLDVAAASGLLTAMDVSSGKIRWQEPTGDVLFGGSCATAGGLVFMGEADDNPGDPNAPLWHFTAFDARNGDRLFRYRIPGDIGVNAPCVSYEVDQEQFIAVAVGGLYPGFLGRTGKSGDTIYVFGLPED